MPKPAAVVEEVVVVAGAGAVVVVVVVVQNATTADAATQAPAATLTCEGLDDKTQKWRTPSVCCSWTAMAMSSGGKARRPKLHRYRSKAPLQAAAVA